MFKLSKKAEYAIMAARHMALNSNGQCVTAKEISESYSIPYELVAKVLQRMAKMEILKSFQGSKGGYHLVRNPDEISLIELISSVDSEYKITACFKENSTEEDCTHINCCKIRDPLSLIQQKIDKVFLETSLTDIL